ncbi:MAG: hypothetical protein ACT6S0_23220 [Roseateles sp.]|uniref:hypothetical protein n=1 Tax=Roseateles sp. TaxID=1971397 RepID=UPI004036D4FA
MSAKALPERAKHRLRLAAGLLRSEGHTFDVPRDEFYDQVQKALAGLSAERQARLKSLVDWVEVYDNALPSQAPTSSKRS